MCTSLIRWKIKIVVVTIWSCLCVAACNQNKDDKLNTTLEEVAGSEEVLNFMKTFEGRGLLSDSSEPRSPEEALAAFRHPADLALDLVLSEPEVTQPVFMNFDHRGRLWVVQYNQYPYPKGLKVLRMDQYTRAEYDRIPDPPPAGERGADKITFFEDTDGDGSFDAATDAITGLNIATSVALGRGKIWVLDPPFLLAYPDGDYNGIPDGQPVVHLRGFGLEDTHAVANNLRWGPDGWLYGAQGSTCTANISSSVTKNVVFNGQAIWRYHPEREVFEIFAEGGGNTFDIEIDAQGRIFSGDNGTTRGRYYKQGAYFTRSLGKHGSFTNPYTFGNLRDMTHTGDNNRFTHAFVRYQEEQLPPKYHNAMIAINPLQSYLQLSKFKLTGSSFSVEDELRLLETDDHWFRPVDVTTGPDGAVYIADWYDSRLSHVDPRDTWSKNTGRIYRLRARDRKQLDDFDLTTYPNEKLIDLLSDSSRWFRQQALLEIGNRRNIALVPGLERTMASSPGQLALEALWAINLSGGFSDSVASKALQHPNPHVRLWAVRLLGDANEVSEEVAVQLATLASAESEPEVRSQLAATAKRLPGESAIPVVRNLLKHHDDSADPDIPLQLWWAIESKATSHRKEILALFEDGSIWTSRIAINTILERLMQRWVMEGGDRNLAACAQLLRLCPSASEAKPLLNGLEEGLRGRSVAELSPDLIRALKPYQSQYQNESSLLMLRQGNASERAKALKIIADNNAEIRLRLLYIKIFGEIHEPASVPVLLKLLEDSKTSIAIKQLALQSLSQYDSPDIGARVTKAYPDLLRYDVQLRNAALGLLAQRKSWAVQLLSAIDGKKQLNDAFIAHTIDKSDVSEIVARQMLLLDDASITKTVGKLWPNVFSTSTREKNNRLVQVHQILNSGRGNESKGGALFERLCAGCHRLFEKGANLAPDLTGYDRKNIRNMLENIIDPNAYIREGYVMYHITTRDDRSIVGTLKDRNGSTITLQSLNGEIINLHADQISAMDEQEVSLMPEGLLNGLTDEQIRDLMAYISSDR